MKKISAILLLCFYLPNIGEFYLWFTIKQYGIHQEVRQTIKRGLNEEDLVLIVDSPGNHQGIFWIEKGKEFLYKREMYDVVKSKISGEKTYYYCLNDTKEKQLISDYTKAHDSKSNQDKRLKRIFNNDYFPQYIELPYSKSATNHRFARLLIYYKSFVSSKPSPPPKASDLPQSTLDIYAI